MRFLLTLAAYAAMTVACFAQTPREVTAPNTVSLRIGQTRTFNVDRGIVSLGTTSESVAKTSVALSDREFYVEGVGPGEALITLGYNDGTSYRMNVNVGGRTVRIYGNERRAKASANFFCTNTECTRSKTDDKRTPTNESIAVTGRDEDGNIVTTTKTY